jgi:methylthioribose-1-phosphate isomerase
MVASIMAKRGVDLVVVGADRIARSGDVANKIGTYGVACLAHMHGVPFYVAAPWSTVDLDCPNGDAIPIEQRSDTEVSHFPTAEGEVPVLPDGVGVRNPAFDVTPARLVRAIYTEKGAISPVGEAQLLALR